MLLNCLQPLVDFDIDPPPVDCEGFVFTREGLLLIHRCFHLSCRLFEVIEMTDNYRFRRKILHLMWTLLVNNQIGENHTAMEQLNSKSSKYFVCHVWAWCRNNSSSFWYRRQRFCLPSILTHIVFQLRSWWSPVWLIHWCKCCKQLFATVRVTVSDVLLSLVSCPTT